MPVSRKFTLDTNLFIRGFRDTRAGTALDDFHRAFSPFEYLTAIVAQELRAGAMKPHAARQLQSSIFAPFERKRRVVSPTYASWKLAGETMAALANHDGTPVASMSRSFVNDVLLAATCREFGLVLVSDNVRDFSRIAHHLEFDWVEPWPDPD